MSQVNISINGRDYLLNCGEGEEDQLSKIATYLNEKITRLDRVTKQSGDTNLMLTAALLASSDVLELRSRIKDLSKDIHLAQQAEHKAQQQVKDHDSATAEIVAKLASRIEQLSDSISKKQESPAFRAAGPAA